LGCSNHESAASGGAQAIGRSLSCRLLQLVAKITKSAFDLSHQYANAWCSVRIEVFSQNMRRPIAPDGQDDFGGRWSRLRKIARARINERINNSPDADLATSARFYLIKSLC
jgi:hypothetical protein